MPRKTSFEGGVKGMTRRARKRDGAKRESRRALQENRERKREAT